MDGGVSISTIEVEGGGSYSGTHSLSAKTYNIKLERLVNGVPTIVGNGNLAISN